MAEAAVARQAAQPLPMVPRMTPPELDLFRTLLRATDTYLEFGTGGSTVEAAALVRRRVVSVDSSEAWLAKVAQACAAPVCRVKPELVFADIGPVARWGRPADDTHRHLWSGYHEAPWQGGGTSVSPDLCLIDGRFRVASFLQSLLRSRPDTLIAFHDFHRRNYHAVCEVARIIARVDTLAVLVPRPGIDRAQTLGILAAYRENPD